MMNEGSFPIVDYPRDKVTPSMSADIPLYPCNGGYHDYAVGIEKAICNKCSNVVPLLRQSNTTTDHTVINTRTSIYADALK